MPAEENKALVRRLAEECWGKKNLEIIDEIFAADYTFHEAGASEPNMGGPERVKQVIATYIAAFPDLKFTIDEPVVADADMVAFCWTISGTHQGWLTGIAPTNKEVKMTGISIEHITDGKIRETWDSADKLGLLQQLGVIPAS